MYMIRSAKIAAALFLVLPAAVRAQQPAPERVIEVSGPVEGAIASQVEAYGEGVRPEVLRQSDVLLYPYGVYQPVLSCTVLRACIVELEEGEHLISLIAGDDQRWLIDHTATGPAGAVPLVSVKPTDHDITTNLIISTDRRVYHITLDSPPRGRAQGDYNPLGSYTRHIRFYYPADGMRRVAEPEELGKSAPTDAFGTHHWAYSWKRLRGFPWEPLAVFDDGSRVFIRVPREAVTREAPPLLVRSAGREEVANYILEGGFYVVAGLFEEARLIGPPARRGPLRRRRQAVLVIRRASP